MSLQRGCFFLRINIKIRIGTKYQLQQHHTTRHLQEQRLKNPGHAAAFARFLSFSYCVSVFPPKKESNQHKPWLGITDFQSRLSFPMSNFSQETSDLTASAPVLDPVYVRIWLFMESAKPPFILSTSFLSDLCCPVTKHTETKEYNTNFLYKRWQG